MDLGIKHNKKIINIKNMNKKAIYESIMSQVAQVVKKQLNENMEHEDVWDIFEEMKEMLGAEELVNELAQALSTDELEENLRFIDKNHDLGLFRVNDGFDDEDDDDIEL